MSKIPSNLSDFDNPFVYDLKLTIAQKIRLGIGAIFLFPLRAISIIVIFLTAFVVAFIATIGYSDKKLTEKPLTGWRRKLQRIFGFLGRSLVFCFGFHRVERIGKRSVKEARILVAAPHSTFLDTFVFLALGLNHDLPSIVSRSANVKIPIIGYIFKVMQPILVTREDEQNKERTIDEVKRRADPANKWPQIFIFPEGTTTNGSCLISFKSGAFIPGEPIQPILIQYKNSINTITWSWIGFSAIKCILLTLCQFNNKLQITFLPVYFPNNEEKQNSKIYSQNIQKIMASYLNLPVRNYTFEDCRLMKKAKRSNLPLEAGLIEFVSIKSKLNVNYKTCQEVFEKFAPYARQTNGRMSIEEFTKYLNLKHSTMVDQLFSIYDKEKQGFIEFRAFLIAHLLLSKSVLKDEVINKIFQAFDKDNKGYISRNDLKLFSDVSNNIDELFDQIDSDNDEQISYDELKSFSVEKPELMLIMLAFSELQSSSTNTSGSSDQMTYTLDADSDSASLKSNLKNQLLDDFALANEEMPNEQEVFIKVEHVNETRPTIKHVIYDMPNGKVANTSFTNSQLEKLLVKSN